MTTENLNANEHADQPNVPEMEQNVNEITELQTAPEVEQHVDETMESESASEVEQHVEEIAEQKSAPEIEQKTDELTERQATSQNELNVDEASVQQTAAEESSTDAPESKQQENYWNELQFEGKEFCNFCDDGTLQLNGGKHFNARNLAQLTAATAGATVQALVDKFKEVTERVDKFKVEFDEADEKIKVNGKLQRLKSYLGNANAIGDFQPLFDLVVEKESLVQETLKVNEQARRLIVEKAETLKDSEEFKATTEAFKALVEEWKNAPHVEKETSDKLWETIEKARNHFYERKRAHQEQFDNDMMANLDQKMELCELAEGLATSEKWRESAEEYKSLMERWKTIGRVASPEKNDELWNRFIQAKNNFFERKASHQTQIAAEQEVNFIEKTALVERAEAIKESTSWKETADEYAKILEQWKTIGRVPYEKSDELWNRMQTAKDFFFAAKRQQAEAYKVNLEDNYAQKKALVDRAATLKNSTDWKTSTVEINELLDAWKAIGPIPREYGDDLWEQFISARKHFYKRKDEDRDARKQRFVQQIENRLTQSRSFLSTIEAELEEDESKLTEFNEILNGTGDEDAKDKEIKANLVRLVEQIERKIPGRRAKIDEIKTQIAELEGKLAGDQKKD